MNTIPEERMQKLREAAERFSTQYSDYGKRYAYSGKHQQLTADRQSLARYAMELLLSERTEATATTG